MRWSSLLPAGFLVSCSTLDTRCRLSLSSTRLSLSLTRLSSSIRLETFVHPRVRNPSCITTAGLGSFHFARRYFENRFYFLFLRVLRCFSSPSSLHNTIDSCYDDTELLVPGFPIRISTDLRSFATPRSFSQLVTSFFGA